MDGHCPRCGATLPQDDEVICPGCGHAIGGQTVAIEVSPEQLMAEIAKRSGEAEPFEEEVSVVTTTLSGLLNTRPGAEAVQAKEEAERSNTGLIAGAIFVVVLLLSLALVAVYFFGGR